MTPGRSRHRSLFLLGASLGIQILLLAAQVKRDQDVRLIRVWAVEIVAPLGRSANWITDGIRGGWSNYVALRSLGQENGQLRADLDRLKLRNAELEGRAAEAGRLAGLLNFRQSNADVPMLAARVIGASPSSSGRVAFLDRGSRDGVALNMGVITPEGVVGKVLAVYPGTSQVLLVSDKDSGVGALLAGSRTQGPVRGTGDPTLGMEYVSKEVKVSPGEAILTSGQDRIFPKDLPVGTVEEVSPDPHSPFHKIVVKPAAHLDRLEEVLVLLTRQELPTSASALAPLPALPAPAAPKASGPVARPPAPAAASAPVKPAVPVPATQSVPSAAPAAPPAVAIPPAPAAGPAARKEQQ